MNLSVFFHCSHHLKQTELKLNYVSKRLEQTSRICFHFILETELALCCQTVVHLPPTGQGWEL